jgi:hypothetical protein
MDDLTGRIVGQVLDSNRVPIRNATVTLVASQDNKMQTKTDEDGSFEFFFLFPEVEYEVSVEKQGYQPWRVMVSASETGDTVKFVLRRPDA